MNKTFLAALLSGLLLSACGGSDSKNDDSVDPPAANKLPVANFELISNMDERSSLDLSSALSSDADGSISLYSWSLELNEYSGDQISLIQEGVNAHLVVGELASDVVVNIGLTVTDDDGANVSIVKSINLHEVDFARLPMMPPDPNAVLVGVDVDDDGLRDDLEIAIYNLYPLSKDAREITRYAATVFQRVLVNGASVDDLDDAESSEELSKLAWCYISYTDFDELKEFAKLRALAINTAEREDAYLRFVSGRNGTAQAVVEASFEDCKLPQNY